MSVSFNPINHRNHPVQLNFWGDMGNIGKVLGNALGFTDNPTFVDAQPKARPDHRVFRYLERRRPWKWSGILTTNKAYEKAWVKWEARIQ